MDSAVSQPHKVRDTSGLWVWSFAIPKESVFDKLGVRLKNKTVSQSGPFESKINIKKTNSKAGEMLPESSPAPADLWEGYLQLHQRCQTQRFYSFPILQQYMAFSPTEFIISPP